MSESAKASHLLKDEIEYELKIRSVNSKRDLTEKRKILARLFAKERDEPGKLIKLASYEFDFDTEKAAIDTTLSSIKNLIDVFEGSETEPLFSRIKSRLNHVSSRVKRMPLLTTEPGAAVSQVVEEYQNETYASCLVLEADLYGKVCSPTTSSADQASINVQYPQALACEPITHEKISKWNIKFNGDPKRVYPFLEHVSEIARSRKVSDKALFDAAVEFFVDDAFIWFRSIQSNVRDWKSLVAQLKSDFLPKDFDDELWEQIKSRKQNKKESVTIFIAIMENLFSRLSRMPHETTRVKHIRQNILTDYYKQLALQEIDTVEGLKKLVKRLEDSSLLSPSEKSTSRQTEQFCFSCTSNDKTYTSPPSVNGNARKFNSTRFQNKAAQGQSPKQVKSPAKPREIVCWNCNLANHTFQHCTLKKNIHCFRCGKPGVKSNVCSCPPKN